MVSSVECRWRAAGGQLLAMSARIQRPREERQKKAAGSVRSLVSAVTHAARWTTNSRNYDGPEGPLVNCAKLGCEDGS